MFIEYLPILSSVTYLQELFFSPPAVSVASILSKASIEIFHQYQPNFFLKSFDLIDGVVGIAISVMISFYSGETMLLGINAIEIVKSVALYFIDQDWISTGRVRLLISALTSY